MKKYVVIGAILFVVAIMLVVVAPFFTNSYFPMHDDTQPTRIYLMAQALTDGQFPVRWVQHLGYGYGYPIFNFYAPLPYYLGSIFILLGIDAIDSAKILFGIVTAGAFLTMYFFLKHFVKTPAAITGAVIYLLFPYHAVNTYVRGALSEQFGYLLIPIVMLFYFKMFEQKNGFNIKWIIIFSISLTALIISHNLSALMTAVIFSPLVILHLILTKTKKVHMQRVLLSLFIVFGLSAFYILPVIFESSFTNVNSQVGGGADFKDHFVCIGQFWSGEWGFGGSAPGCVDGISFRLGKSNIIFGLVSFMFFLVMTIWKKRNMLNSKLFISLWIVIFSLFLMLELSNIFWNFVPFLKYIQYPWRFLVFTGVGLSILIAFVQSEVDKAFKGRYLIWIIACIIVSITLIDNYSLFTPQAYLKKDIDRYTSKDSIEYEISKISDEYLPENFKKPQNEGEVRHSLFNSDDSGVLIHEKFSNSKRVGASVIASKNAQIHVQIAPYPSWKYFVDGEKTEHKNLNDGILAQVPQGKHTILFKFVQTPIQKIGNMISLFTILALGAVIIFKRFYGKKTI